MSEERKAVTEYRIAGINSLMLDNIPVELKVMRRWTAWKSIPDGKGKPKKMPQDPNHGMIPAKTDCPDTWGTYKQAVARCQRDNLAGIQFQFNPILEDGIDIVGIDIDDCLADDGSWVNEQARQMVEGIGSYAEVSPSGRGVKVWFKDTQWDGGNPTFFLSQPGRENDQLKIEVARTKAFTITGHRLGTVTEITDKSGWLNQLRNLHSDNKLRQRALKPNRNKPVSNGNAIELDHDEEADMLRSALSWLDSDDRATWIAAGCSFKAWGEKAGDDTAKALWDEWSARSPKFDLATQSRTWRGFTPDGGRGVGSIFADASDEGYEYGRATTADGTEYIIERAGQHPEGAEWVGELENWHADFTQDHTAIKGIVYSMQARYGVTQDNEFPSIITASSLVSDGEEEPPQVICGMLHRGSKMVYGGPSKAYKSWSLIDMCIAVATGEDWLGFRTTKGRALYVNLELQAFALRKRIMAVCDNRGIEIPEDMDIWNLRGKACGIDRLIAELEAQILGQGYDIIVPDPIYKVLAGGDENSTGDIIAVCNAIERLSVRTGAAVAFGAHFAKGNASAKESIDRISGSGVWARDPDAILTATTHEQENCFTLDMTLRNFPPPDPVVIRWDYPRMRPDETLDPEALKKPKTGRESLHTVQTIMSRLGAGLTTSVWCKQCAEEDGVSRATFFRLLREAKRGGMVVQADDGRLVCANQGAGE